MSHVYALRTDLKPKSLQGISENQIAQHWALFEGYIKNVNLLAQKIDALAQAGQFGPEFAELKRRFGFEYDGMVLHERYFGSLKAGQPAPREDSELARRLQRRFGGFENWKREFAAIGMMRGIGWAVLYFDPAAGVLTNCWIDHHEIGHPAGCLPVVVMDVWEHAYVPDYGTTGRSAYIEAFFKNVDWPKIEREFGVLVDFGPRVSPQVPA